MPENQRTAIQSFIWSRVFILSGYDIPVSGFDLLQVCAVIKPGMTGVGEKFVPAHL